MITYGLLAVYEITRLAHQSVRAAKQRAPDPDWAGSGQVRPRGGYGRHQAVPQPHGAQQGRTRQASHPTPLLREGRHV